MKTARLLLALLSMGTVTHIAVSGQPPTNAPPFRRFELQRVPGTTNRFLLVQPRATNAWPAPGVYKTEPFTCIVIVPGAQSDDRALKEVGPLVPPMPQIKPELRFIPRK